ncbi:hypothetical protein L7F22_019853 [Adiantum nelumboides]|nr:hypothetical protein [Adiantum nelumboides]
MDPDAIADEGIAIDNGEQNPNLPLLIVGPSGSGKTYELNIHTIAEIRKRLKAQNDPAIAQTRALCMTPFNTATSTLTAKVMKGLEVLIAEDFPLLSADRPPIVDPNCTTVHHTCRKWLATYGHLIGEPNMAEVCSEERAKRLLELLQSPENFDFYEQNQNDRMREVERVRNELEEELTLAVPNLEELEGAMLAAKACKDARLFALTLQEFIRVYKINDFRLVDELFERFGDRRVDAGIELFEWYERILRHNRLYDFEDLVIFGLRLAERHARHIIKSEKVGMIVIDDFQNSYGQQRRFLKALMSVEGSPIRLIVACHDHHIAQTMGGQLELLDRTAYAFTGAHIS